MPTVTVSFAQRTSFCITHLVGAAMHAKRAHTIEAAHTAVQPIPKFDLEAYYEHRASVIGALIQSAAAVEAAANEVFLDAIDNQRSAQHFSGADLTALKGAWTAGVERLAPLDKCNVILATLRRPPLVAGSAPLQDARLLFKVRNELMHAKTQTVVTQTNHPGTTPSRQKFEAQLGQRFTDNPLAGPGNAYFPDRMFSAGCARWAVASAVTYLDTLNSAIGRTPPYEHVRPRLP
jgi:hypothetical protein